MATYSISVLIKVINQLSKPIQTMAAALHSLNAPVKTVSGSLKELGEDLTGLGYKMNRVGRWMSLRITAPLVAAGTASLHFAMEFDKAMALVESILPPSKTRIYELKESVVDLSKKTGKSTDELATGLFRLVQAFGDSSKSQKIFSMAASASVPALTSVANIVDLMANVGAAYGDMSAKAAQHTLDLAFYARKAGRVQIADLTEFARKSAIIAHNLGITKDEFFAAQATISKVLSDSAQTGTTFAYILTSISKYKGAVEAVGNIGFPKMILILAEAAKRNEELFALEFGGSRTITGIEALAANLGKTFKLTAEEAKKATGEWQKQFKKYTEGIGKASFQWDRFKQELKAVAITIGDALKPAFIDVLNAIKPFLEIVSKMNPKTLRFVLILLAITAAVGPLISLFANLTIAMGGLILFSGFIAGLGGSAVGMAVFSLVALKMIAIVTLLVLFIKDFKDNIRDVSFLIGGWLAPFKVIGKLFKWLSDIIKENTRSFREWKAEMMASKQVKELAERNLLIKSRKKMAEDLAPFFPIPVQRANEFLYKQAVPFYMRIPLNMIKSGAEKLFGDPNTVDKDKRNTIDINMRLNAAPGTEAMVEGVSTRGNSRLKLSTEGYVGSWWAP